MVLVKVLKRKDASSVLVAVVLALIVSQALSLITGDLASTLSGLNEEQGQYSLTPSHGWEQGYLYPVVWAFLQVIALEVLAWIVILVGMAFKPVAKKK